MTLGILLLILSIIVLLLGSAFFSGSETALTAASEARIHGLANRGDDRASAVEKLRQRKEKLISSLLIGNNLVNVLATSLATSAAISYFGETGVVISTVGMTILLVLFAEVIPKTYAFNHADRFALGVAKPVRMMVLILTPFTAALNGLVKLFIGRFGSPDESREDELRGMIALHGQTTDDAEAKEQTAMLASVLDLGEVTVEEVMTHRGSVMMINAASDPDEVFRQVMDSPYTRHPVYSGKTDNIIGVLHVKALLRGLGKAADGAAHPPNITDIAADPYFTPETTLLIDQLQAFRSRREHFAVVVDEYGDFRGIVTLEDILEEIVGDIDDEHDLEISGIRPQADGSWIVDGIVTIRDLNRALGWSLPDDDAATIAGLVLNETRTIPSPGQEFRFHGTRLRILRRTGNKLERIRVWHEPQESEEEMS
ncbi:HlyC/CorC family transporter [Alphaproteobacteria bacterium LSUCC0684]